MKATRFIIAVTLVAAVGLVLWTAPWKGWRAVRSSKAPTVRPVPAPGSEEDLRLRQEKGARLQERLAGIERLPKNEQARLMQQAILDELGDDMPPEIRARWEAELREAKGPDK